MLYDMYIACLVILWFCIQVMRRDVPSSNIDQEYQV